MNESYVLGLSGERLSELDGTGNFLRSHVYAAGELLATYESNVTQFSFSDWLGSKRVVAGAEGGVVGTCANLPFGDELNCTGVSLGGHHFTGQIHDQESFNDYFGARYYNNFTGLFMSPDWSPGPASIPFADPNNPQSLNLYAYVNNNPLSHVDKDGHLWEELKNLWNWGHYVNNAGLNAALQNDANQARSNLSGMKGFTLNGQSPADFAKGANNQQAIRAEQTVVDFLSGKVMQSLMGGSNDPRIQVGIVFPMDFPTSSTMNWSATVVSQ